jgi:hypothetical protein
VDLQDLKQHAGENFNFSPDFPNGLPYNWIQNYHNNPYDNIYNIFNNARSKDRMFGYMSLAYAFDKWFNVKLRAGDDWSTEFRKETTSNRDVGNVLGGLNGQFYQNEYHLNELNLDALVTGGGNLGSDFTLNYTAGANYRDYTQKNSTIGAGDLTVPNFYTISNALGATTQTMYDYHLRSNSLFAQASVGYKNWLSLDVTARNDWSSSLPSTNRSYFYPSVSASVLLNKALNINVRVIDLLKLRVSWSNVGNDMDPYQTVLSYGNTDYPGGFAMPGTLYDPYIRPERRSRRDLNG